VKGSKRVYSRVNFYSEYNCRMENNIPARPPSDDSDESDEGGFSYPTSSDARYRDFVRQVNNGFDASDSDGESSIQSDSGVNDDFFNNQPPVVASRVAHGQGGLGMIMGCHKYVRRSSKRLRVSQTPKIEAYGAGIATEIDLLAQRKLELDERKQELDEKDQLVSAMKLFINAKQANDNLILDMLSEIFPMFRKYHTGARESSSDSE